MESFFEISESFFKLQLFKICMRGRGSNCVSKAIASLSLDYEKTSLWDLQEKILFESLFTYIFFLLEKMRSKFVFCNALPCF